LKAFRRLLTLRHQTALRAAKKEPRFFLELPVDGKSNHTTIKAKG
jgi:hypothetical protein